MFIAGLSELNELCLDNTLVTDVGLSHVAGEGGRGRGGEGRVVVTDVGVSYCW